jgi:hypothetical protein
LTYDGLSTQICWSPKRFASGHVLDDLLHVQECVVEKGLGPFPPVTATSLFYRVARTKRVCTAARCPSVTLLTELAICCHEGRPRIAGSREARVPILFEDFMSLLQSNGLPEASANLGRGGVRVEAEVVEEVVARLEDAT